MGSVFLGRFFLFASASIVKQREKCHAISFLLGYNLKYFEQTKLKSFLFLVDGQNDSIFAYNIFSKWFCPEPIDRLLGRFGWDHTPNIL